MERRRMDGGPLTEEQHAADIADMPNRHPDDAEKCEECGGSGAIDDGGCGGGCDFCWPFPKCQMCNGTGQVAYEREQMAHWQGLK